MARAPFRLGLTRDQLASFLKDFEQIKQFEQLFQLVDEEVNANSVTEANTLAGNANARAQQALDTLERISNTLEALALAPAEDNGEILNALEDLELSPAIENNGSIATNYIDYNINVPTPAPLLGRTYWNGGQTISVQQTLNVAGKVNEDNFYYIKADSTISKGQLIMFTGAVGSSGVLRGAPAAGLGVNDGVRLMGVAAENIATNGFGLVQWSGTLRGFNTTGAPYGEVWADGDILYYNPAFAGGLTKNEPVAPNVRAVIAAVVNAGSGGSGSIVIRLSVGSVLGGTDSNVYINSLANDDLLQYDSIQQRWENHTAASVTVGKATNVDGGAANQIVYQTAAGVTGFIVAPTIANTYLEWSGSAFQWSTNPLGTVTSVSGTGTVNGITLTGTVTTSGSLTLGGTLSGVSLTTQVTGTLPVANGGTGTATAFTAGSVVFAGASGIYSQDNANFFWDNTNKWLGLGTATPANSITIDGGVLQQTVYANPALLLVARADGSKASPIAVVGGTNVGGITGQSYDGAAYRNIGSIRFLTNGTTTSTSWGGDIVFQTGNVGAGTVTTKMRLDSPGNLGLGVTPSAWGSFYKAIESTSSSEFAITSQQNGIEFGRGYYKINSGFASIATTTQAASKYGQDGNGIHSWYNAAGTTVGGTITFTERMRLDAAGYVHMLTNPVLPYQGAQTTKAGAATLSGAELVTGILQYTGNAQTVNFPTGTNIEGALTWVANNTSLDFFVINTGTGTCTMGANGNTTVGTLTVAAGVSGHFRIRRTAANTFTIYRLA